MKILKKEYYKDNFIFALVESSNDQRFHKGEIYFIDEKPYRVFYSKRVNKDKREAPTYDVSFKEIKRETKKDFLDVDFRHIWKIERTSARRLVLRTPDTSFREYNYMDPKDCLTDYILVNEMRDRANGKK